MWAWLCLIVCQEAQSVISQYNCPKGPNLQFYQAGFDCSCSCFTGEGEGSEFCIALSSASLDVGCDFKSEQRQKGSSAEQPGLGPDTTSKPFKAGNACPAYTALLYLFGENSYWDLR